jgi:hypothetical protein
MRFATVDESIDAECCELCVPSISAGSLARNRGTVTALSADVVSV